MDTAIWPLVSRAVASDKVIDIFAAAGLKTAQVITELIELAKEMRAAHQRGEQLGLSEDELAFYNALEVNDSAVRVLGDEMLRPL